MTTGGPVPAGRRGDRVGGVRPRSVQAPARTVATLNGWLPPLWIRRARYAYSRVDAVAAVSTSPRFAVDVLGVHVPVHTVYSGRGDGPRAGHAAGPRPASRARRSSRRRKARRTCEPPGFARAAELFDVERSIDAYEAVLGGGGTGRLLDEAASGSPATPTRIRPSDMGNLPVGRTQTDRGIGEPRKGE